MCNMYLSILSTLSFVVFFTCFLLLFCSVIHSYLHYEQCVVMDCSMTRLFKLYFGSSAYTDLSRFKFFCSRC
jgi:hypothetical protein